MSILHGYADRSLLSPITSLEADGAQGVVVRALSDALLISTVVVIRHELPRTLAYA